MSPTNTNLSPQDSITSLPQQEVPLLAAAARTRRWTFYSTPKTRRLKINNSSSLHHTLNFQNLAHGPRGSQAKFTLRTYKFQHDGSLVLLNIAGEGSEVLNPAFSRFHPRLNVVYTCTEDIEHNGVIIAYDIHSDGSLTEIGRIDAGGTSTCYLTIDREQSHLIACNYWDSTLVVIPISIEIHRTDSKCL